MDIVNGFLQGDAFTLLNFCEKSFQFSKKEGKEEERKEEKKISI